MTTRMLTAALLVACSVGLGAQSKDDLFVNDPRPVAEMARKIEQQTGWTITYEDPSYQFGGDIFEEQGRQLTANRSSGCAT